MDHRNILATGFLLLCGAVFAQSLKSANASMPVGMQHGQFPYEHFTECDLPGAVPTSGLNYCTSYTYSSAPYALLTVPSDRIFVVTGASAGAHALSWRHPTSSDVDCDLHISTPE